VAGACRPAAGRPGGRVTGPPGASAKIFAEKAAGVYFYKFRKQKFIFVKNENKKIKKPPGLWPVPHELQFAPY